MTSRLYCWKHGHDWGPWEWRMGWWGEKFQGRFCQQCGVFSRRP